METRIILPDGSVEPRRDLVTLTHVIYGLHALSLVIGIVTAATVVTAFVFGWPSIIAVIINYVKRSEVRGTWLESHFRWQIRTFWWTLAWIVLGVVLVLLLIGFVLTPILFLAVGLWACYRIIRGWLALRDRRPLPMA